MDHLERPPPFGRLPEPRNNTLSKSRKHKIVLESVTQEKKKLYSVLSFDAEPPKGYTFVPAGNPALTTQCKEMAREDGLEIYAVSMTPHKNKTNLTLSHQVHRVGYHFPSQIVARACFEQGLHLSRRGRVMTLDDIHYPFDDENKTRRERAGSAVSQTALNTDARDTIKDLFPNIPEKDLTQIISTAFQKGTGKVGVAAELSLVRRAQLAVVAHIRHVYTNYDRLLRLTSYQEARTSVEPKCLEMLVDWRGSDENGARVLEDTFREVIVLSDEEDSDEEEEDQETRHRDSSIEFISSTAFGHEVQTQPINFAQGGAMETRNLSDEDAPPGYRIVPAGFRKKKVGTSKADRRGFIRYQAWGQAFNRYRRGSNEAPPAEPKTYSIGPDRTSHSAPQNPFVDPVQTEIQRQYSLRDGPILIPSGEASGPPTRYVESMARPFQDPPISGHTIYHRMISPQDGPIRIPDERGPQIVRLSDRPMPMRSENEPQMITLRPVRKDLPRSHMVSQDLAYSADKVRNQFTELRRPAHRPQVSIDATVLPSIEGPQVPDSPQESGPLHQKLKLRLPPALEQARAIRHLTPEGDRRRGDGRVQKDPAMLNFEEQRPRKRQRLLPDHPHTEDFPNKRYNVYQDGRTNSSTIGMPYDEVRLPPIQYLSSDPMEIPASLPPRDSRMILNSQLGLPVHGGPDESSQTRLRPLYETSAYHTAQLNRQIWDPHNGRVLVNRPSLQQNSPSITSNLFSQSSQVDDTSPSIFRKDEGFVRPFHFREIVRPLSDVGIRDQDVQRPMLSDHLFRKYDHEVGGRQHSRMDEDPFNGRRVRYVPVPDQETDRVVPAQGPLFSPSERVNTPHRREDDFDPVRRARATRAPPHASVIHSGPYNQLRQTVASDRRPLNSGPLAVSEYPPAFPTLRRAVRTDEYIPHDSQSHLPLRSEREIGRELRPTSQAVQYAHMISKAPRPVRVNSKKTTDAFPRYPNTDESLPRLVRYEDRVISSIPSRNGPYYQPVPARGEVIVLE